VREFAGDDAYVDDDELTGGEETASAEWEVLGVQEEEKRRGQGERNRR